jgi:hypothetical protein
MHTVEKTYQQPFLVEPTKLERLLELIHQRMADHQPSNPQDAFELFLTGNRREEMTRLSDVLATDNSNRHRVRRLIVSCTATSMAGPTLAHQAHVDFGLPMRTPNGGNTTAIAVRVQSESAGWANRTLAEIEEQIERTKVPHRSSILGIVSLTVISSVLMVASLLPLSRENERNFWLNSADRARVEEMLKKSPTLTNDDLREVWTAQLKNVVDSASPTHSSQFPTVRTLILLTPLAGITFCGAVLLTTCYPTAVFLWGDEVQRNERITNRRRILWGIIIGVTVIGVCSRLLWERISPLL